MNILFFTILTAFLIILQTITLPSFSWFGQCFDLMIVEILFLGLMFERASIIPVIILLGCIMDSISGVPFFLHVFSYLWIYIIVQLAKQLVFHRSIFFILMIAGVSVLVQQGILLFSVFVRHGSEMIWSLDYSLFARQLIWGLLLIPPAIWLVNACWRNFHVITKNIRKQIVKRYED